MTAGQHAAPTRFRRFRVWPRPAAEVPAQDTPPAPEVPGDAGYDDPGWGDELHDATSPGFPLPAPDDTMVWRVPGLDGGPGLVIPPATLETPEEPLPARVPGAAIPPALVPALRTEPADPALLREVADALKALPGDPPPAPARPVAWLRVIENDGRQAVEALSAVPEFAGTDTLPDGTAIAGAFLGIHGKATWIVDAVDPAWCEDAITALTAMRDALVAAQGSEDEGTEAA